jgi:hypothetical protein
MSYTIAVPSSSIIKVLNYGISSITASGGGVSVANGAATITSVYPNLPNVPDLAYQQANSAYFQANTATGIAQAAYSFANTLSGGSSVDNVARVQAQAAYDAANTYFANTQNSITYITGVNNTQNTTISLAYARANTSVNTVVGTTGTVTTSNGRIVFQSTNGVTIAGSGTSLTINTPQALRTTDAPTFNGLSLTNALAISQGGTGATSAISALTNLLPSGTTAGYVLTTGGPGTYYWAAGGGGGGGGATPGTTISSTRLTYTANGSGLAYTTPTYVPGASQLRIYFDGVRQFASEYTETSATVVTFNSSPTSGTVILIEVDGYINNPYYANNITFTAPFGSISASANTIQLAIQDLETRKAALASPSFTGVALSSTPAISTSNTQIATTGFVHTLVNSGITFSHSITGSAASATSATTASTANALNTSNNYRVNSLGVGTDASGTTGEIRATNEVTAYYSSDERLKENIEQIDAALYKLRKIRGVMFDWTDDVIEQRGGEDKYFVRKHDTGVIAQEVEQVLPEVVAVRKDGYKAVRYEKMAGLIIQAINELADEVDEIKQRLK